MNSRARQILRTLIQPRAMVVGLAVLDFAWMIVRDARREWEFINYHGYYADTHEAFILLIASLALLFNRTWTCLIAAAFCTWTIYVHVFATLQGISNAHDIAMFGAEAWRRWLLVFQYQPQYALHLTLALLIFVMALLAVSRRLRSGPSRGVEQIVGPERGSRVL